MRLSYFTSDDALMSGPLPSTRKKEKRLLVGLYLRRKGEVLEGAALNGGRGTPKVPVREWLGQQMESRPRHWKTKHCLETTLIGLEKKAKRKVMSQSKIIIANQKCSKNIFTLRSLESAKEHSKYVILFLEETCFYKRSTTTTDNLNHIQEFVKRHLN